MLLDEFVYAAGVRFHHFLSFGVEQCDVAFSCAAEAKGSKLFVDGHRCGAQDLRKLAPCGAPQEIHLPEAVLRHDVPLRLCKIFHRRGANVRDTPKVAFDCDLILETGQGSRAIDLWQWPVDKPPDDCAYNHNNDGKSPGNNSKKGPQGHSQSIYAKI